MTWALAVWDQRPFWSCHACGAWRDDADILVHHIDVHLPRGILANVNLRYCADKPACCSRVVEQAAGLADRMLASMGRDGAY